MGPPLEIIAAADRKTYSAAASSRARTARRHVLSFTNNGDAAADHETELQLAEMQ